MPVPSEHLVTRHLDPDAVPFDFGVAYKFLKLRRASPNAASLRESVARDVARARGLLTPRYRYRVGTITRIAPDTPRVFLGDGTTFEGPGLCKLLRHARYAAFFALTIGDRLDVEIAARARGDFTASYLLDGVASTFVEGVGQVVEQDLKAVARSLHCTLSRRFSPGYHGWDLRQQRPLFAFLNAHEIGLSLSDACFMQPQKSLSGVYAFRHLPIDTP